jgi:hypothetical protein
VVVENFGFLSYNPDISQQLEIIYIDYKRSRPRIIEYLGEENQSSPVLPLNSSALATILLILVK